jgi:aspartate/methionine/tyrosine aminotransferase
MTSTHDVTLVRHLFEWALLDSHGCVPLLQQHRQQNIMSLPIAASASATAPSGETTSNVHVSHRSSTVASFKVMDVLKRANQLQASGHHVLHCEVGQPETGAPAKVREAALAALSGTPQVMGYTDAFGLLSLRQKICEHYQSYYPNDHHNYISSLDTSRIVVTTGSSGGFLLAFTACFDVGDVVAIASCGYPCYRNILSAFGCQLLPIPINDQFKLTARELQKAIDASSSTSGKKIRGLILSSPSNPTGAMLTPEELKEICDLCDQHQIQFLSDEIYHGIYCKQSSPPEATALQFSPNVIVINSFSKYYSSKLHRL